MATLEPSMTRSPLVFRLSFLAIVAFLMAMIWLLLRQLGMPASFATCIPYDLSVEPGTIFLRNITSSESSFTAML